MSFKFRVLSSEYYIECNAFGKTCPFTVIRTLVWCGDCVVCFKVVIQIIQF